MEHSPTDSLRDAMVGWFSEADEVLEDDSRVFHSRHIDEIVNNLDSKEALDLAFHAYDLGLSLVGGRAKELKFALALSLFDTDILEPAPEKLDPVTDVDLRTPPELYLMRRNAYRDDGFGYGVPDLNESYKFPIAVRETPFGGFVICSYGSGRDGFAPKSESFSRSILFQHYLGFRAAHPEVPPERGEWPFPGRGYGAIAAVAR